MTVRSWKIVGRGEIIFAEEIGIQNIWDTSF